MDIIDLSIGDPRDLPPSCLIERAVTALGEDDACHYPLPHCGDIRTKEAVCHYYTRQHDLNLHTSQTCITHGALPALTYAIKTAECESKVCGVFAPFFPAFVPAIETSGYRMFQIPMPSKQLKEADLDRAFSRIANGLFLLNNPHNPSGRVFSEEELRTITRVAQRHSVSVISDAVYIDMYEGPLSPISYLKINPASVEIISLSKTFRMPGYRVGAVVGRRDWVERISDATVVMNGVPNTFQKVAQLAWVSMPEAGAFRRMIARRRAYFVQRLQEEGFSINTETYNRSGIFVWAQVPKLWPSSRSFCEHAALCGVHVSNGEHFGIGGPKHIRWSLNYGQNHLELALSRLSLGVTSQALTA
jgi:aspartate/methionine/tyrosine aminotransferase